MKTANISRMENMLQKFDSIEFVYSSSYKFDINFKANNQSIENDEASKLFYFWSFRFQGEINY